jgi:hypothetical protein
MINMPVFNIAGRLMTGVCSARNRPAVQGRGFPLNLLYNAP